MKSDEPVYQCRIIEENGIFGAEFPDLPSITTVGRSKEEAIAMAEEALNAALAVDVARGLPLLQPRTGSEPDLVPIPLAPHVLIAWELRQSRGSASQAEIASRLGLSYQAYQRLENPLKANPSIKTLEKAARALGKRLQIRLA